MVWAMRLPSSFGDFFPDGTFTDRSQLVADHIRASGDPDIIKQIDMFDDDISVFAPVVDARLNASQKFTKELGPLEEFEKPRVFETVKSYDKLASIINTENQLIAIDEDLKSIIEVLEPGVHQIWPFTIKMPKGKEYPKQYYGLRISAFMDSFSPEKSKDGVWRVAGLKKDKFRVRIPKKDCFEGLAMESQVIEGAHLWRENRLRDPDIFFSDALHDAIVEAGLSMPAFFKLKAV